MRAVGFALMVVGGGWIGVWLIETVFVRAGIYQAMGDVHTAEERSAADERGRRHQRRMLAVFGRGLVAAIVVLVAGVGLLVAT